MIVTMVYQHSRRLKLDYQRVRLVGLFLLGAVLVGAITTVYADAFGSSHVGDVYNQRTARLLASRAGELHANHVGSSVPPGTASHKAASSTTNGVVTSSALQAMTKSESCNPSAAPNPALASAQSPELRKLAQYEQLCNGAFTNRISFFTTTPTSVAGAQSVAASIAAQLKEFASFGISPLIFMEPNDDNGNSISLTSLQDGTYDNALNTYFTSLKADGISDATMGMWVYLPEGDIPVWSTTDPSVYSAIVVKLIQMQKKYFPSSKASLLLDSESYAPGAGWGNGNFVSFLPYVSHIPAGLVDSFGLQGFPWAPAANVRGQDTLYSPSAYLRIDFAAQAARALGTSSIWFNTGTFHSMYASTPSQTVIDSPAQRQTMLNGVISLATSLKAQGFSVAIHIFAQNKAGTDEDTDWSYWNTTPGDEPDSGVLTTFIHNASTNDVPIWLFDSTDK